MSFDSPQNERRVDANKKALARYSGAVSKVPFNTVIACNVLSQKLKQVGIKRIFLLFLRWLSPRWRLHGGGEERTLRQAVMHASKVVFGRMEWYGLILWKKTSPSSFLLPLKWSLLPSTQFLLLSAPHASSFMEASLPKGLLQAQKQHQFPKRKFFPSSGKAIAAQNIVFLSLTVLNISEKRALLCNVKIIYNYSALFQRGFVGDVFWQSKGTDAA